MTVLDARRDGEHRLREAGIESARLDSDLLLVQATQKPREWLLAHGEEDLPETQALTFNDLIEQRAQRIPLVHLTHTREFYGLDFYIDDGVLTPRVETETMVGLAVQYAPEGSRLIDIGTGSGALAVTLKKYRPDLDVVATDISERELGVARRNAIKHDVVVSMLTSDLFDQVEGRFATVVTNLPYLRDDAELMPEVQKEPAVALFGGEDGLELYRRFLRQLPDFLEPGGYLFTECDPWQHESLIAEAGKVGLKPIEQNDYFILGFQTFIK